jgi:hypothetical protein
MYYLTPKRFLFDTGVSIVEAVRAMPEKVVWEDAHNFIWIKNFFRHQVQNDKFTISALKSVPKNHGYMSMFYQYNKDIIDKYQNIDLGKYGIG